MKEVDSNEQALKHLYGKELLKRMADALSEAYPAFDRKVFIALMPKLEPLEMKPRVQFLREQLKAQLPPEYPRALEILMTSARAGGLKSFDLWPYADFVRAYGLEDLELSLDALRELTTLFTAEFAVRPFLIRYPRETLAYLEECARSENVDVRRWASEGTRPRLPWGERLQEFVRDPSPTLRILEILKHDPELYVRKSVSNHLNDIAKDHPDRVIEVLGRWKKQAPAEHADKIDWIIHRSLRTLIKAGHPEALKLIGVSAGARVKLESLKLSRKAYRMGDRIEFAFRLRSLSAKPQKLVIDYVMHFMKANQKTAPKVFKLRTLTLPPKAALELAKSHPLKKITTRVYYPGKQRLCIQVNGQVLAQADWRLG